MGRKTAWVPSPDGLHVCACDVIRCDRFDDVDSAAYYRLMASTTSDAAQSILQTHDRFIAAVPWGRWRSVLVYRRRHGGRTWIRLRTWNRHRKKLVWYPTKRYFVIPIEDADSLANAIRAAVRCNPSPKPDWLVRRERLERLHLEGLQLPPHALAQARRRVERA